MAAFIENIITNVFNLLRKNALKMNCSPNFDSVKEEVLTMNENGKDGRLYCLCKIDTPCPCKEAGRDLKRDGVCYCGIFRRVKK